MKKVGFIGLGNMGGPMAANLVKAGFSVTGFDLVQSSIDTASKQGVVAAATAIEAAKNADAIVTMLPAGKHVLQVWPELLAVVRAGTTIIDCSTIDVESARKAHEMAKQKGVLSVDAPVSGGVGGATGATLTFMCGGEKKAFEAARNLLQVMGKKIVHCGDPGAGQAAKICVTI